MSPGTDRETIVERLKPVVNFLSGCFYQFVAFFIFVIALAFFFYFLATHNINGMMISGSLVFLIIPIALIFYMLEHWSRPNNEADAATNLQPTQKEKDHAE